MDIRQKLSHIRLPDQPAPPAVRADLTIPGGQMVQSDSGRVLLLKSHLLPDERLGPFSVCNAATYITTLLVRLTGSSGPIVALDLETTGIRGGSGCCPFVIGLALIDGNSIVIEQLLLPDFPDEQFLLQHTTDIIATASVLLTFNGRSFDWPVFSDRFPLHRLPVPPSPPHVDLLHIARTVWGRHSGCSLQHLEQSVLRFRRPADIDGSQIPAVYFDYLNSGRTGGLRLVLEHNRLDLMSLLSLTAVLSSLVADPLTSDVPPPVRAGLGRFIEQIGDEQSGFACYQAAAPADHIAARHLVRLYKRNRQYDQAADICQMVIDRWPEQLWAYVELAKHLEHRQRQLQKALAVVMSAPTEDGSTVWRRDFEHRRQRLVAKISRNNKSSV